MKIMFHHITRLLPLLGLAAILFACGGQKTQQDEPEASCTQLDSIFTDIHTLESQLSAQAADWAQIDQLSAKVVEGIRLNMASPQVECLFINQKSHPKKERFGFLEPLSSAIIREKQAASIIHIFQLGRIFKSDPEISEFIGEELGHIAYDSPETYSQFLTNQEASSRDVIQDTRWRVEGSDSMAQVFQGLGQEAVSQYLEEKFGSQ
ncbi:MAG: hypothetical protein H6581_21715 [Bacteroidia bacterium]|nr:hypothetical protein [Bacteroidia bacterium]